MEDSEGDHLRMTTVRQIGLWRWGLGSLYAAHRKLPACFMIESSFASFLKNGPQSLDDMGKMFWLETLHRCVLENRASSSYIHIYTYNTLFHVQVRLYPISFPSRPPILSRYTLYIDDKVRGW